MKINKGFLIGMAMTLLIPIVGFVFTLVKINRKNYSIMMVNVFIFIYLVTLNLHPYQDLYRRYIETYNSYNDQTTYFQAFFGHVDFTFYFLSLTAKKLAIPFPFLVSLLSASSAVLFLKAILSGVSEDSTNKSIRLVVVLGLMLFPLIQLALGIRWGLAISIMIYGYFCLFSRGYITSGIIVISLSIMTHFSMVILVPVLITSSLVRLRVLSFISLSIISALVSTLVLPFLLSKMGSIGSYATIGYGADNDINATGNLNSIIATGLGFVYTAYFTFLILLKWKRTDNINYVKVRNVTLLLFVFTCLSAVSAVAFRRYTNTLYYLFCVCTFLHYILLTNKVSKFIILICILSFVFNGLFLQRRPLILSEAWKGLYTPSVFYVLLSDDVYHGYLKDIDDDGDWKGNKINKQ